MLLKGHIPDAFGFFIMHTPRLIVAALGALAWLAPVTDAADDLQAQVEQLPQKLNLLIGKSIAPRQAADGWGSASDGVR
jgi:hypothetical protein